MNSFSTFFTLANIDVFIVTRKIMTGKFPIFGNVFNFMIKLENSRVNPGSFHVTFWELISCVAETEGTFPDSLVSENDQCVG